MITIECFLNGTTQSLKYPALVDSHYGTVKITMFFYFSVLNKPFFIHTKDI